MFFRKAPGEGAAELGSWWRGGGGGEDEPFRFFLAQKLTQILVGFGKDDQPKWLRMINLNGSPKLKSYRLAWVHCGKVTMGWDGKLLQRPSWILKMFDLYSNIPKWYPTTKTIGLFHTLQWNEVHLIMSFVGTLHCSIGAFRKEPQRVPIFQDSMFFFKRGFTFD